MDILKMDDLMQEIHRGYRVLGAENGELQNLLDIRIWYEDGYITEEEQEYLRNRNKEIYNMLKSNL